MRKTEIIFSFFCNKTNKIIQFYFSIIFIDLLYRSKRWLQCNNQNLSKPPIVVVTEPTNQSSICLDYKKAVTDTIEKLKDFQTQYSEQVVLETAKQITILLESVLPKSSIILLNNK